MRLYGLEELRKAVLKRLERRVEKARLFPELLNRCESDALRLRLLNHLIERGHGEGMLSYPPFYDYAPHPYPDGVLRAYSDLKTFLDSVGEGYITVYYRDGVYLVAAWALGFCLAVRSRPPEPFLSKGERITENVLGFGRGEFMAELEAINSYVERANAYGLKFQPVSYRPDDITSDRVYLGYGLDTDGETGLYRLGDKLLKTISVDNLGLYAQPSCPVMVEAGEEDVREARERVRLCRERDLAMAEAVRSSQPIAEYGKWRFYRLDTRFLRLFLGEAAEKVRGLGEFIIALYKDCDDAVYVVAGVGVGVPLRGLACCRVLQDAGVSFAIVRKDADMCGMPSFLVRLSSGFIKALDSYYNLMLNPRGDVVGMARRARVLYEDGKLVLLDEKEIAELEAERG